MNAVSQSMVSRILEVCVNDSVRRAGQHLLAKGALSPSIWLQSLSNDELQQLMIDVYTGLDSQLTCIELTCIMLLGTGEILEELNDYVMAQHAAYVRSLVTFESLHRKGVVVFLRDNISFDLNDDSELVQRTNGEAP